MRFSQWIAVEDFDNDGVDDLAVANRGSLGGPNGLSILLGLGDEDATFRILGQIQSEPFPTPTDLEWSLKVISGDVLVPISFRRENVEPEHLERWKPRGQPTPFFRAGVQFLMLSHIVATATASIVVSGSQISRDVIARCSSVVHPGPEPQRNVLAFFVLLRIKSVSCHRLYRSFLTERWSW